MFGREFRYNGTGNLEDWDPISYRFADLQWGWLRMRNVSLRVLFLLAAMAVFASPLVAMADDFCRCPQCARGTCFVKSTDCPSSYCSQEVSPCCDRDVAVSKTPGANHDPVEKSDTAVPEHESRTKSKDCRCSTYLCYDGNGVLPVTNSILFSTTDEFYRRIPKSFVTSGWVYQILHPPR